MIRRRVLVSGRVQGVWYRQSCADVAHATGVHGWVQNNADGTVEAVLEGAEQAVESVIDWMRHGPRLAVVRDVRVTEEPVEGETSFTAR